MITTLITLSYIAVFNIILLLLIIGIIGRNPLDKDENALLTGG